MSLVRMNGFRWWLAKLIDPGGQLNPPMPFFYKWRWRFSRALSDGWGYVRRCEEKEGE